MIKLLYILGLSTLVVAGMVFMASGKLWRRDTSGTIDGDEAPIVSRFQASGSFNGSDGHPVISPLVQQATAYALYLTPPAPKTQRAVTRPQNSAQSLHRPSGTIPKFRLLSTTYYRSHPDKSWALVSEPGKGSHWVRKDERLGRFVVESVERGSIIYRDGDQLREEKVPMSQTVQLARAKSDKSVATQVVKPNPGVVNLSQSADVE